MKDHRVLVTGWRNWPERYQGVIRGYLDAVWRDVQWNALGRMVIVQGECPYGGVDLYAKLWAEQMAIEVESYPAEVDAAGKILGPARNSRMVALGAERCLGFPGPNSRGTWDCIRKAVDADIPTYVISWSTSFAKHWADE